MNERIEIPEEERWRVYEAEKNTFMALHPEATHEEYEKAIHEIKERCGV